MNMDRLLSPAFLTQPQISKRLMEGQKLVLKTVMVRLLLPLPHTLNHWLLAQIMAPQ